ncbi:Peripheral-type benzodiazepine receptor-associated protein 1 [Camponotus floridanus]|uniref:Peripheral-type benzodiazepine receptor-associated protein 1 n=1 Tax=Camponotus floridanus TaxID=104421 RepID=E2ADJ6_CAMFO|nr:Peripheral-type benzodiazepine receptor-associated protein 1 [Camponotus floridanus]
MLQCCGVGGGASTAPHAPQLQGIGSAVGATTSTRTTIMQDAVLESILEQMRETEARRAELERQHADAQNQLREKIAGRYQGPESVEALQSKIRELEKKTELQMVKHEELSLELTSLRRARSRGPIVGHVTSSSVPTSTWPPAGSEIDRIIAKIEQDNSSGRMLHDLDHARGAITTQQPSATQGILRSSSENLPNLGQHQHPPHPHALNLGMPTQMGHYAGSPMPLTPMMPGCPPLTPNGPPYHYSEPIPPAPSLSSSQSQPAFQQKIQQYQQQPQQHDLSSSHSQGALPSQQKQQQQTHTSHFTSNQYQESYPHTQTYQQPLQQQQPQQQQQQHPASTTYLTSASQSVIPHYTQPAQTAQNYQLNGSQQATTYPNLSMASHPNGTYSTGASSFNTQLPHHNYSVPQTNITQTTLPSMYSTTSYHSTLGGLTSVPQSVLPFSTGQSTFATSGSTYSTTVGTNAFGTSGVSSGTSSGGLLQAIGDPLQAMQQLSAQSQANQLQQQAIIHQIQQSLRASSPTAPGTGTGHHFLGPRQMPKIPTSILTNPLDRLTNTEDIISEGQVDMLDVPGKGRCYVYIARFSYEPFQHSPNANPEAELPVQGGDYLLVWSQPDDDGFLDAETLDGRRGLVPANFVQKLVGDDLLEFHQAVLGLRDVDDSASTNIPQCYLLQDIDLELAALEEGNRNRQTELSAYAELDNIAEEDEQEPPEVYMFSDLVPAPQHLTLERQLNKSVLIGWTAPENTHQLESYHVYVDGVLKVTVKATERTRALVEGVDSTRPHRISVRSVTHSRRTSRDAACTMVIGKDVALGPTAVKASAVTATSAVISWLPSNSNHQHVVCVNNVEVRTVKPGVYRHTITGLAPSTIYRVTVKAKNLRATHFEDQNAQAANNLACHVHFKTLPKGLPDPPVDIQEKIPNEHGTTLRDFQVEAGPQDGTLLVTWQPVALNGSAVTGYAVYADGKKVTDVDSPTGDHALVDIHKLMGLNPKHITVRTKSRESQSGDSCATAIPCSVLRGGAPGHMPSHGGPQHMDQRQQQSTGMVSQQDDPTRHRMTGQRYPNAPMPSHMRRHVGNRVDAHGQVIIETDENLSDKEIYPGQSIPQMGIPEITKDSASEANYSEEDDPTRRSRGMPPQHHGPHHRYGPQMDSQGPPGTHRSPNMGGPSGRPQDPYYDQTGSQRGRGPVYRGGRVTQAQGGASHPTSAAQQMNKRQRLFVALFDYDPTTMSPNPDACEEELPFSEGDTIKVYGEKDADGFYWGECRGRRGYVPYNMVEELKEPPGQGQPSRRGPTQSERWGDIYASMPVKKMIALYDYDPHELSPNVDAQVELTFQTGNEIYVYGDMDDDGFYMGELNGVRGLVPSNFLTEAPGQNQGQPPLGRRPGGQSQGPGARGPPPPPREPPPAGHRRGKDACIVPVSVPVCHLDSRQLQQQPPPSLMNNQQHQLQHQNNPPHLAYQQANHHSYTTVTTSNQHGPSHLPPGGGVMGAHQQGPVPPHLQQQSTSKPMRGIPAVLPTAQSKTQPNTQQNQQQQQPQQQSTGPNLMQKFTEMAGASAGGDILSKGKELIFMKFGLGK